ncbi:MAG: transcriptional regulator [Candidatus Raymondbacteria bacterium RifOxyA12_full_50_37]|uniref:Probable transcriptional regulatory protein A2519_17635 n=1 Tax=Candidatus Raymondbacteria bacterium RIFOXYD12_FULL_49_13 TaxID=1817890 RepID=A0A1F7F5N2_UNCRA|nr:MAG: transcriptional regulator [Candidatus Raymondbacteria bacterium RifOxyA12_full_50_37]OGJ89157.1 MAG: transcriptional regulator [Candidatus Raymondbacteria bacterium RIFOXYA2_FULL_49_16]OGJ96639.1 MAG: transcriptional regulator [Candidatus Raymondbacteria bacterium RIFOXYC2_FULL_50_21]OGK01951.1 MAG: transcriptional regulator [Candidatus Raymondbacteria bacterium RIFOXYD12_FULL_49_13]OGP42199.1 MAG: transcriptional regulator [Candidatus Raymondbacteria bacterium RIFOXYB2_FULL_49_35]
MSGHSKWATIKRKKGALDAKRGQVFTKIIREITTAARLGGGDPDGNPRLRLAVDKAKENNMPAKNVETAIAKGSGTLEGVSYEENTYEAYAAGGVAVIIEALTDNKNRTVSEIRHIIEKGGGNLGTSGSVAWMFKSQGSIVVAKSAIGEDQLMELVLEAGADDMEVSDDAYEIKTAQENYHQVKMALEAKKIPIISSAITKAPSNTVKVSGPEASKVLKLIEALEEHEDVQNVYANFDIDEKELETLAG